MKLNAGPMFRSSSITADMRAAATTLEKVAKLYHLSKNPGSVELSADWLRVEADVLDKPIPDDL